MLKAYVQTRIVNAEEEYANGLSGYRVYDPNGSSYWMPALAFEPHHREITGQEREVLAMTTAEATISRISDG